MDQLKDRVEPEDLARSLIREFFLKHKYAKSLEAFEKEDSRTRIGMTKIELIRLLSMERLVKNNKIKPLPQQSLLEILADYLFDRFRSRGGLLNNGNSSSNSTNQFSQDDQSTFDTTTVRSNRSNSQAHDPMSIQQWTLPVVPPPPQLQQQVEINPTASAVATGNSLPAAVPRFALKQPLSQNHNDIQQQKTSQVPTPNHQEESSTTTNAQQYQQSKPPIINRSSETDDFHVESRRGNMRKVSRRTTTADSKENPATKQQSANDESTISRVSNSQVNSELFRNIEDIGAMSITSTITGTNGSAITATTNSSSNTTAQSSNITSVEDQIIFGEFAAQSRIITRNDSNTSSSISKPSNNTSEQQQQPPDQPQEKQFNFFGKKKPQVDDKKELLVIDPPKRNQSSGISNMDDFDQLLDDRSTPSSQQQQQYQQATSSLQSKALGSRRVKKGPFNDDDEDLDFSSKPKASVNSQRNDNSKSKLSSAAPGLVQGHVKLEFNNPGNVTASSWDAESIQGINYAKSIGKGSSNPANSNAIGAIKKSNASNSLTNAEIADIKKLLFNQAQNKFLPLSWAQGFYLSLNESTFYGIVQKEGGPCGVLACVQAFFIKHLFFVYPESLKQISQSSSSSSNYDFTNQTVRENCLVAGLAEILFRARDKSTNMIHLAVVTNRGMSSATQAIPIESCGVVSFKATSFTQVYENLHAHKQEYLGMNNSGVTIFLYSVILTKGIIAIQSEMDSAENALIGHHGHCSQEQVNLFLTGRARTNCFDGMKVLDGDFKLGGIDERAQFGFLTIFEHLKYIDVGDHLKTPLFPVWIICKEYHYSVVFAKDYRANEVKETPYFDLVYYDQLYNHEDRILLTLTNFKYAKQPFPKTERDESGQTQFLFKRKSRGNGNGEDEKEDEDMIPVIELVLRTKWGKQIELDWNGTQPIL